MHFEMTQLQGRKVQVIRPDFQVFSNSYSTEATHKSLWLYLANLTIEKAPVFKADP